MAELVMDRRASDQAATPSPVVMAPQQRYINRELSWLAFNERVLDEAVNTAHPLLERIRFLSISDSNLDEFYMVRVAGLKELAASNVPVTSDDGLSAPQQLAAIAEVTERLVHRQQACWAELQKRLAEEGFSVLDHDALTATDHAWLRERFIDRLLPVLTPIAIDPAHPFPFVPNRALVMVVELSREDGSQINALVMIPEQVERFIRLPGEAIRFTSIEAAIVAVGLTELFPGMNPFGHGTFACCATATSRSRKKRTTLC